MGGKRVCTKCQEAKLLTEFRKDSSRALGHSYICKPCNVKKDTIRYESDVEGQRKRSLDFYAKNKERQKSLRREWYRSNSVFAREERKKHYYNNVEKALAYNVCRKNKIQHAVPSWLTAIEHAQIQEMYDISRAKTMQTGIKHHVDHIFPLQGEGFNGLHVPWNLAVITASKNLSKRNKFPVEYQHLGWGA